MIAYDRFGYAVPEAPLEPPEYPEREPEVFTFCAWCGDEILEGDDYYMINEQAVCGNCIGDCCRTAERSA